MSKPSLNKVFLIGQVEHDPELKTTEKGQRLCKFVVKTKETWNNKQGEPCERTERHHITCWGRVAQNASNKKEGETVWLEGRLQRDSYLIGASRVARTEIVAQTVLSFGPPPSEEPF